ncbi:thioesterase family protein [Georgenia sp. SYP-B2076]|uniref:acyl-CoA thioesterase n=1 Tax=Georgenia sp. SYP-B2076 TaxID=2495881 RepID=UPI0013E06082|nr:acyl-ACP thioesterase domain-containing protein [Georgenia sp. SYP-B2076]
MTPSTHTYEIPIRWRDLDFLEHVTNVVYTEFATDALAVMRSEGMLRPELSPVAMHVDYVRPVDLDHEMVRVVSTLGDGVVEQEMLTAGAEGEQIAARVRTELGSPGRFERAWGRGGMATSHVVRPSDIGPDRQIPPSGVFTFFQEARARLQRLAEVPEPSRHTVVVHSACWFGEPLVWTPDPYTVRTWVEAVGSSSVTFAGELGDAHAVYARSRAVVAGFDRELGSSRPLTAGERGRIQAYVSR